MRAHGDLAARRKVAERLARVQGARAVFLHVYDVGHSSAVQNINAIGVAGGGVCPRRDEVHGERAELRRQQAGQRAASSRASRASARCTRTARACTSATRLAREQVQSIVNVDEEGLVGPDICRPAAQELLQPSRERVRSSASRELARLDRSAPRSGAPRSTTRSAARSSRCGAVQGPRRKSSRPPSSSTSWRPGCKRNSGIARCGARWRRPHSRRARSRAGGVAP